MTSDQSRLLAQASLLYDAAIVDALREAGDDDLIRAALDPRFLALRHRLIRDELQDRSERRENERYWKEHET